MRAEGEEEEGGPPDEKGRICLSQSGIPGVLQHRGEEMEAMNSKKENMIRS